MKRKNTKLKKKYPTWNKSWQSHLENIAIRATSSTILTYEDVREADGLFNMLQHKNQMSAEVELLTRFIHAQYALDKARLALDNYRSTAESHLYVR